MHKLFLKLLIIISFCQGLLFYVGIPNIIYKSLVIGLVIVCLSMLLIGDGRFKKDSIIGLFILYSLILVISSLINSSNPVDFISYILYLLPGVVVYTYMRNVQFNHLELIKLNNLFFFIYIFQIFFSVLKLIFWGRTEAVVGTMHYSGGSLNTVVPLVGISMLIAFYVLNKNKPLYIFLILGFLFMGWVGEKRGIYFYFIALTLFAYYFNSKINKNQNILKIIRQGVILSLFIMVVFYIGAKYTLTLNPESIIGGSFDFYHIYNYAYQYSTNIDYAGYSSGRFSGLIAVFNSMLEKETINKLFGFGPSELIGARFLDNKQYAYGVSRLMAINGWSTSLISIGFIGALTTVIFYFYISVAVYNYIKIEQDPYWKSISFGIFLITIVFFLDFFTYTRSFYHSIPLNITLLYGYGILKTKNYYNKFQMVKYLD